MEFPHQFSSAPQESDFPFEWSAAYPLPHISSPSWTGSALFVQRQDAGGSSDDSELDPQGPVGSVSGVGRSVLEFEEVDVRCGGLRVVGIDSDSDTDYLEPEDPGSFDLGSQINGSQELGLEEDDRIEEVTVSSENFSDDDDDPVARSFEWEFLLAIMNSRSDSVVHFNPRVADRDDYVPESNSLWQQVAEDMPVKGNPPAAKFAVENLPVVVVSEDDLERNGGVCAVCKDEISLGETVKKLPCLHYYHVDCILPWLEIRNSCPVCRFEFPTDDLDYERNKSYSSGGGSYWNWDAGLGLDFELFA